MVSYHRYFLIVTFPSLGIKPGRMTHVTTARPISHLMHEYLVQLKMIMWPGPDPTNKKFYTTPILKHSYWLKFCSNQSECLKTSVEYFCSENIFIGSGPGSNPIKILMHKLNTTLIFKHFDWLLKIFNQSKYLKICVA